MTVETAARRALIAYDWIGHGHNRAKPNNDKLTEAERIQTSKCFQCGKEDSQGHWCMLDCKHPSLQEIRVKARLERNREKKQSKHTD